VTRVEVGGTPVAAQVSAAQAAFPLNPGESAIIPPLATGEGRNDGTEPVVLLAMFVGPPSEMMATPEAEATPGMGEEMPAGLTFEPLAFGVIDEWPGGPAGLLIARITIPGGAVVPQVAEAGAEIGYFESGSFTFQTGEGPAVQVVRGLAEMDATGAEPTVEATSPDQGVTANAGDAFFTPPGAAAGGEAAAGTDVVALIAVVEPLGEAMATPAP
jgi:quercetin dioxygenase-like cupin family protein